MKWIFLIAILASSALYAEVINSNEQSLADDLGFKLSDDNVSKRKIASDRDEKNTTKTNDSEEVDQQRDIASEVNQQEQKVQFWKY
ncbi:MAG: hypothetical protein HON90_14085 [Halobacteriovoraceae bacterium]|nr:hypothetical protein [Halobacteriovoraceae bacterium]